MREEIVKKLHEHIERRNKQFVEEVREGQQDEQVEKKRNMHKERGAEIVKVSVEGDIVRSSSLDHQLFVDYCMRTEYLIQLKDELYIEEERENRRAIFTNEELVEDAFNHQFELEREAVADPTVTMHQRNMNSRPYNRREAVRYAERWWDDYNPGYRKFTDNCTNFISQCLRAGGASMTGHSNREKGWWYRTDKWSLSWAVAHSLRWYLSGAQNGLRGIEKERASELEPGDLICYDFDGDGRWQHTTIVVAKDPNGEPLVNAQTANSRMRYWKYEDSTAWTPNIKYKFFQIVT
ncbi:amidase domain-containing protein [Halalkalibacter alkalisediminis]|uniref:Amidase domain-containing protein n=2 Tax=Halalkalibacter alkalisediminis TaxID=935616 RepID=A0ABV6NLR4_9BACI|nr:amidase domain-containing protein [Halalkalibacter alkalisediminis]